MSSNDTFSFKQLLANWPRGEPRSTADLAARGMSPYRASALARSGWLEHVARGVYKLPADPLDREACLVFLSKEVTGLHIGGKTALDLRGVRHNVSVRAVLTLWGDRALRLPAWFTQRFPCRYCATPLFDQALPTNFGLQPLPNGRPDVLVSVPERAILELLCDVGKRQTLIESKDIVEGLPGLRADVLDELLAHTQRVKVVRLAHALGSAAQHPWASVTAKHVLRLGNAGWVAVTKSGERIDLRG